MLLSLWKDKDSVLLKLTSGDLIFSGKGSTSEAWGSHSFHGKLRVYKASSFYNTMLRVVLQFRFVIILNMKWYNEDSAGVLKPVQGKTGDMEPRTWFTKRGQVRSNNKNNKKHLSQLKILSFIIFLFKHLTLHNPKTFGFIFFFYLINFH